jgi:hypothetical protein
MYYKTYPLSQLYNSPPRVVYIQGGGNHTLLTLNYTITSNLTDVNEALKFTPANNNFNRRILFT